MEYLVKMLNKHHEELQDAQQERHELVIADLQYDLASMSNRSNANNLVYRKLQTGSKSPLETIRATGSNSTADVAAKDVRAKAQAKLVKTFSKERKTC